MEDFLYTICILEGTHFRLEVELAYHAAEWDYEVRVESEKLVSNPGLIARQL